ncbi:MAG: type II toxin-antitoxin system YafQ family toxin [Christensenellaceae bacterium]|jgi:mRNA interferase YafQ|nr:type II toxin-antitoxin system YafQ family toxin [Christensenellaceae bacterium]
MKILYSNLIERDIKKMRKRNYDMSLLKAIIQKIANEELFEPKYKLHILRGEYAGMFECHIKPDWLLIWIVDDDYAILHRTGTHSDLFD